MAKLLPHEIEWLKAKVAQGELENHKAALDMGNAVENGNVWHDNAEYDAAIEDMKRIDATYGPIINALGNAEPVAYPVDSDEANLGSLLRLKDNYDTFYALLIGMASLNVAMYDDLWASQGKTEEDLTLLSAESPMGQAVLGKTIGTVATWSVETRHLSVEVVDIDNQWLQDNIQSLGVSAE